MTATHNKPCAAANLNSYRYRGQYGWIMIGAHDVLDALREAARSTDHVTINRLEAWTGDKYEPVERRAEPPFVDVSTVTEYGLNQKLSNAVRVF